LSFHIPKEVPSLRTRIDLEEKENYPHVARYKEMVQDAELAYALLNNIIKNTKHAGEAIRIREDIRIKLGGYLRKSRII